MTAVVKASSVSVVVKNRIFRGLMQLISGHS